MEVKSSSIKKEGETLQVAKRVVKKQNVAMAMEVFDSPVCPTPLRPPIFQVIECFSSSSADIQILSRFLCWSVHFHVVLPYLCGN